MISCAGFATSASAVGYEMFSAGSFSTGEKPQSKLWYHDGSYWGALKGPDGVAIYEKAGTSWVRGPVVSSSGYADVKWNGTDLFVLVYAGTSRLYKYSYNSSQRQWTLLSGFPVNVPTPSGSETMVIDQDSSGRVWATAEGGTNVNVYYTTTADHRTWSSSPIVLQTGIGTDDITSVLAFGGNKIGVFWSDQNRDHFGFRVHSDSDAPTAWGGQETIYAGSGHADDHINLAFDSSGRVYAVTKDDHDKFAVHRRDTNGTWTTKTDVAGGSGTRPIIMVAEQDSKVYVLYTRWGQSPETIQYRVANISDLAFGGQVTFISSSSNMNNVTGMKQLLPPGSLIAAAENGSKCMYNSFGSPPAGGNPPPGPPANLVASLLGSPARVDLGWNAPSTGTPDGYNVYRQVDGGSFQKLNGSLVTTTSFTDTNPATGQLCYQVTASKNGQEGAASNTDCVDNSVVPAPGPPQNLTAAFFDPGSTPSSLLLPFDEGGGQTAFDQSGNANNARLGSSTGGDGNDPTWVAGVSGTALQFDGSNDYVEVADSPTLDMAGSFTIEAWVRHNSGTGTLVNKGPSGSRTCRLRIDSSKGIDFRWDTTGGSARTLGVSNAIPDNAWHHVACVYDQAAGQNRVYVDGVLKGSASASGTPATNSQTLQIGARLSSSSFTDYLNGALDALRFAPGALYTANFTPPTSPTLQPPLASAGPADAPQATSVQLQWQAPASGGAAGYNVFRSVNGTGYVQINAALVTVTHYTDSNLVPGNLCYEVAAVNAQSVQGLMSNSSCVDNGPPPSPAPGPPLNLTAARTGAASDTIVVQWQAPNTGGAPVGYNVYRSENGGSFVKRNASLIPATDFVDTGLVIGNLCYRATAVDALPQEGTASNTDCVNVVPAPPGAPQNVAASFATTPGGPTTGAGAWLFDEGSGQTAADATGLGHTGQLGSASGVDTADPAWAAGVAGNALSFDGSNDRVSVPDAADLRFTGSFTLEAWVKRSSTGTADCVLAKGDSQRRNYWMMIKSGGQVDFRWEPSDGTNHGTATSNTIVDASWHHIACVYDQAAGQDRVYIDGVLAKQAPDGGVPTTSSDPLHVGARPSGSLTDFFAGSIDLVRVSPGVVYTANFTPPTTFGGGVPTTVANVTWEAPAAGTPSGYDVYRQVDGGVFAKLNATLVIGLAYTDTSLPAGSLCYQVTAVDAFAQEGPPSAPACPGIAAGIGVAKTDPLSEGRLEVARPRLEASPNPFNPSTVIAFRLQETLHVRLAIYDARGRRVARLVDGVHPAGAHRVTWNGRSSSGVAVASGTYFLVLDAGSVHERRRLVLLK